MTTAIWLATLLPISQCDSTHRLIDWLILIGTCLKPLLHLLIAFRLLETVTQKAG